MNTTVKLSTLEAGLFNILAHPTRLEILDLLRDGEACVCHIQAMLDQRQAYISQHLNVLRQAGLVINRKEGLRVYYRLSDADVLELLEQARKFLQSRATGRVWSVKDLSLVQKKTCHCPQCAEKAEAEEPTSPLVQYA